MAHATTVSSQLPLPDELVQRVLLYLPRSSMASCVLTCKRLAQLVAGSGLTRTALWRVRLREEKCDGALGCRLAQIVNAVRRGSSFAEFLRSVEPLVKADDSCREVRQVGVMNNRGCIFARHYSTHVSTPREDDLPPTLRGLALLFADNVYNATSYSLGASPGYLIITPCAARALAKAAEWLLSLLYVACVSASLPLEAVLAEESPNRDGLRGIMQGVRAVLTELNASGSTQQCIINAAVDADADWSQVQVPAWAMDRRLLEYAWRPYDEDTLAARLLSKLCSGGNFGSAGDDAGRWEGGSPPDYTADRERTEEDMEDEFFGGGGYGVRYVAQTTRLVGPEPQVLVTGADVLDAMLLPCVWPVSFNHGFARTVTAEIFAELNRELPELRALARTQFGYESLGTARHETQSPLVRRYITALHREENGERRASSTSCRCVVWSQTRTTRSSRRRRIREAATTRARGKRGKRRSGTPTEAPTPKTPTN